MAKTKKQEVVEETTPKQTVEEITEKQETVKVDLKNKFTQKADSVTKVDLSNPPTPKANEEQTDTEQDSEVQKEIIKEEVTEEIKSEQTPEKDSETPIIEEVTEEEQKEVEEITNSIEDAVVESKEKGIELPEDIQKLVNFMEETGGDLSDYVKLNRDYSEVDDNTLLKEYYKQTKPHLTSDEIDFLMEDDFQYDEEIDDDRNIKRKKLAFKEQVASARKHLDGLKSNYYREIKSGSKLTNEQQEAISFFNRYNEDYEEQQKVINEQRAKFENKTNQIFNKNFKGFEYNIGDKKFRFNIKDGAELKERHSNPESFFGKFLKEDGEIDDARGFHKSMFTAMNSDAIANHFYEQGKADALKDSITKSKNIDMQPRQAHGEVSSSGVKYKVLGNSSNDLKLKIKNKQ